MKYLAATGNNIKESRPPVSRKAGQMIAAACLLFLAACGQAVPPAATEEPTATQPNLIFTPTPGDNPQVSTPHVSPYIDVIVEDVQVRTLETSPVQVEITIRGTLPDQCQYKFYSVENRQDSNIRVSLKGIHPADTSCAQSIQSVEYVLPLGRDLPEAQRGFAPGEYQLVVNGFKTVFFIN